MNSQAETLELSSAGPRPPLDLAPAASEEMPKDRIEDDVVPWLAFPPCRCDDEANDNEMEQLENHRS